ncbi:response regulator [Desulfuribacillus alkaliarsenatis]|uniref:Response regulatory domain-containing protein n=1 Tax=Desulfuribacillus alkaliarsenatis TaxID=766136 RepID=A0A1E5G587_9FIRM|nr:response regulator [Desulfuribacillus alkaliarsenatis]OEF98338.1 hypothetical protein BHF68_01265 [Desulfuribacillus alkaliarsenatis]
MSKTKKLLICDDSLLIRMQLKDFISSCNYTFDLIEAKDGEEAYELYKQERPSLVFLDVVMPKLDGIACLRKIRELDPDAKVVMLTSVGTKEVIKDALQAGAADFMQKPWQKDTLVQMIDKFIPCEVNFDA